MEGIQRRRFRDFVIFVVIAVYLLGVAVAFTISSLFDPVAREHAPESLVALAGLDISFVIAAYQVRPRPMDRRVLLPIETGCLFVAATIASNLISAVGGSLYVAAGFVLITLAIAFIVVGWQVSEVVGPKPVETSAKTR